MQQLFGALAALVVLQLQIIVRADISKARPSDFALFQSNSMLFGMVSVSATDHVAATCAAHLQAFQAAVLSRAPWAMKMLDASGGLQSGFIFGDNYWLGSRATCDAVQQRASVKLSPHIQHRVNAAVLSEIAGFATDYRVVYLLHNSTWQLDIDIMYFEPYIHVGLCVPSACSSNEIQRLLTLYLQQQLHVVSRIYDIRPQVSHVKELQVQTDIYRRPSLLILCALLLGTLAMTLLAFAHKRKALQNNNVKIYSRFGLLTDCYDIERNWTQLFAHTHQRTSPFYAINGARFLCACGVAFYHTLISCYFGIRNKMEFIGIVSEFGNLNISIDVFFVISGFFYTYQFLSNTQLLTAIRTNNFIKNAKLCAQMLFHRLLRLLPLYIVTLCLSDIGSKVYEDISLFHIKYRLFEKCAQYWWRNLLFIHNLYESSDACILWTWSLGCDMQFFILATLVIIIYVKQQSLAKYIIITLLLASIYYTIAIAYKHNIDSSLESTFAHLSTFYIHPLPRLLPYTLGAVAAWLYVQQRTILMAYGRTHELLGTLSVIVFLHHALVPIAQDHSVSWSIALLIVQRLLFALSSCCILLASGCGRLRWFCRLLELDVLQKFSQCAYAMYLLHPGVIIGIYGLSQSGLHMNLVDLRVDFIGIMVILLAVAVPYTLLFDLPYRNISRLLRQRRNTKPD